MEGLEKLSQHDLRIYAREIGVKAPTSFTKANLIEEIKKVESGKVKPYFSKRGRPFYEDNITISAKKLNGKEKSLNERIEYLEKITKEFLEKLKKA